MQREWKTKVSACSAAAHFLKQRCSAGKIIYNLYFTAALTIHIYGSRVGVCKTSNFILSFCYNQDVRTGSNGITHKESSKRSRLVALAWSLRCYPIFLTVTTTKYTKHKAHISGVKKNSGHACGSDMLEILAGDMLFSIVMMTSSNGNIFRVTDPLCGELTGHHVWIPRTKASDAKLWYFPWSAPEQTIE